jgi:hypothetical protein
VFPGTKLCCQHRAPQLGFGRVASSAVPLTTICHPDRSAAKQAKWRDPVFPGTKLCCQHRAPQLGFGRVASSAVPLTTICHPDRSAAKQAKWRDPVFPGTKLCCQHRAPQLGFGRAASSAVPKNQPSNSGGNYAASFFFVSVSRRSTKTLLFRRALMRSLRTRNMARARLSGSSWTRARINRNRSSSSSGTVHLASPAFLGCKAGRGVAGERPMIVAPFATRIGTRSSISPCI